MDNLQALYHVAVTIRNGDVYDLGRSIAGYLARRAAQSVLVVFIVLSGVFVLIRLGGDPTALYVRPDATPADVALMRHLLGFDRPLPEQYLISLENAVRGDLGTSFREGRPALQIVLERIPATLELTALALMVLVAVPLGMLAAVLARARIRVRGACPRQPAWSHHPPPHPTERDRLDYGGRDVAGRQHDPFGGVVVIPRARRADQCADVGKYRRGRPRLRTDVASIKNVSLTVRDGSVWRSIGDALGLSVE